MNRNRAVLYLRLSKEDVEKLNGGDDSASIKNQRLLLTDYALENDFEIADVYSDDDESGLYDTRPAFEKMMVDAKLGAFDVIIAKTQARFSRNMEHIEKYLHHDLPNLGIRFIGVVDGTDTANKYNKKSRQINGLVNEWYCEDLSNNIRSAFKAKMKDGQYLGPSCPYGYIKDPENHNHLVIDEYAASIVRRIYQLYLQGYGKQKIGSFLTNDNVLIPSVYKREVLGLNYYNSHELNTTKWCYQTIHSILNNRTYTGTLIQNKCSTLSYKDKKKKLLPESEWIVVENTHEAIIDDEMFTRVQEIQKKKYRNVDNSSACCVFSGLLVCADCKHALTRNFAKKGRNGKNRFVGYICQTYKFYGKKWCSSHRIDYDDLMTTVLNSIKQEAKEILTDTDISELDKENIIESNLDDYKMQLNNIQKQRTKVAQYKKKTYENLMEEIINSNEYLSYIDEYDEQINELNLQEGNIHDLIARRAELDAEYDEWVEAFKNYMNVDTITREMALELIEKIEVYEDSSIKIFYRFQNPYRS